MICIWPSVQCGAYMLGFQKVEAHNRHGKKELRCTRLKRPNDLGSRKRDNAVSSWFCLRPLCFSKYDFKMHVLHDTRSSRQLRAYLFQHRTLENCLHLWLEARHKLDIWSDLIHPAWIRIHVCLWKERIYSRWSWIHIINNSLRCCTCPELFFCSGNEFKISNDTVVRYHFCTLPTHFFLKLQQCVATVHGVG